MFDWLFSAPLAAGTAAPDFTLPDQDGSPVTLSALRGHNVVLIFYPADETMVCTKQLCEFRDHWQTATERNTRVFGVNPAVAAKHGKFRKRHSFPFPLLVDSGKTVARQYNAHAPIAVRRTVYLIGPEGEIRFAQRGKPSPRQVLAAAVV